MGSSRSFGGQWKVLRTFHWGKAKTGKSPTPFIQRRRAWPAAATPREARDSSEGLTGETGFPPFQVPPFL
jgi:hypothetical protein